MPAQPANRPTLEQLTRYADLFNRSKTMEFFGVRLSFPASLDKVIVDLEVRPEHRGGLGTDAVNGGVLSAVFDLAIGCTPALLDPTRRTATMQLSISFLRPTRGNRLRAEAKIDSAGSATIFSSAWILDEAGEVCARCQGLCKISNLPWAAGGTPALP